MLRTFGWLLSALVLVLAGVAEAEGDFLSRDKVQSAYPYTRSDGGEESEEPAESHWDVFEDDEEAAKDPTQPPDDTDPKPRSRFELPGPFPIRASSPYRHLLSAGPSFRNQESRTELGAGFAYSNNVFPDHPFDVSVEPTWVRRKNQEPSDRNFRRIRAAGSVMLWERSSHYEGTAFSATGFYQDQKATFMETEVGLAISQVIGRRFSIGSNVLWRRDDPDGGSAVNAAVADFGASYNFGAGVRFGGFYELYNDVAKEDDWGMFLSYQFLPFAEAIVDGGKNEFVRGRIIFSYRID